MAQHDFDIANQSAPNFRSDLNDALEALASLSSGGTAPSTTYANMLWYDTANNILKMRSEADDAWISIGYLDQTANAFRVLDDTQVVNTSGSQTGLLGDQATATWETGTATTESLVSPAKVKAAIDALASSVGVGQTWQDVSASRLAGTSYQNTTGAPIQISVTTIFNGTVMEVSSNNSTWVSVASTTSDRLHPDTNQVIIPNNYYYRVAAGATISVWAELR